MSNKICVNIKKRNKPAKLVNESDKSLWVSEDLDLGRFSQILHISDIHIRPLQRHDEFISVFKTLDGELTSLCKTPSIIVVTGDVFDNKTIFKPETFKVCRDFFKLLSGHCPVLVIAGNHDMLENNLNRLDGITPVVDDIPNLHYLKYSGIYNSIDTDHSFVVSSLYDAQFIRREELDRYNMTNPDRRYIALYHGTVVGAISDTGYEAENSNNEGNIGSTRYRSTSDFKGYDAVLLGDIHKHQIIKADFPIAYAGSLIQQNHGEKLTDHGILVWDDTLVPTMHPVKNNYGFVDIICDNGTWEWGSDIDATYLPENCYARLIIKNCTSTQVDIIVSEIKKVVKTLSISKKNCVTEELNEFEIPPDIKRKEDEIDLIIDQADQKKYDSDALVDLHKNYQSIVDTNDANMVTAIWKPLTVEFKNMFGYGAGVINRINFKRGVTAIMANNAVGKTSIVNILLFAIFGRTPLNPSTSTYTFDIVNNRETSGYVKILLKYGDKYYLIERKTIRKKNIKTSSAVLQMLNRYDFTCEVWESNIRGEKVLNCSETRKNNNDTFIKELFGDINDFSLSNLLNKESSLDLISMSPCDQVKTLKKLFKMGIYDTYRELNKQKLSDLEKAISLGRAKKQGLESTIEDRVTQEEIDEQENRVAELDLQYKNSLEHNRMLQEQLSQVAQDRSDLKSRICSLEDKLVTSGIRIDNKESHDIDALKRELESYDNVVDTGSSVEYLELKVQTLTDKLQNITTGLNNISLMPEESELEEELRDANSLIAKLEGEVTLNVQDKHTNLNQTLGKLEQALADMGQIDSQPVISESDANAQYNNLKAKLKPLTSDLGKLKMRKDQLNSLIISRKQNAENMNMPTLQEQLNRLTYDNTLLDRTRCRYPVDMSYDNLAEMVQEEYGYTLHDIDNDKVVSLRQETAMIKDKIARLEKSVITDVSQYINVLAECAIIDDNLKSEYQLDKDKEYCLVEDQVIDRLMCHLENEQDRNVINKLTRQYSAKQRELDDIEKYLSENTIITRNIELRSMMDQIKWTNNNTAICEISHQLEQAKFNKELDEIEDMIIIHNDNKNIREQLELLEQSLSWYKNLERRKSLLEMIEQVKNKITLIDARSDLVDIRHDLEKCRTRSKLLCDQDTISSELSLLQARLEQQRLWEKRCSIVNMIDAYQALTDLGLERQHLDSIICEYEALASKASICKNDLDSLNVKYRDAKEYLSVMRYKQSHSDKVDSQIEELSQQLIKLEQDIIPLQDYNEIMGNKGITSKLLFNKIKAVEEYINSIIKNFTRYTVIILYDDKKQTINIITKNNNSDDYLSVSRLSGYEKFILQVSFKRALNKFSYNSKSSLVIIDEALDCIDQDNFTTKLPEVMNLITQDYSTCLAISQRDIQHISDNIIKITKDTNGISYILS